MNRERIEDLANDCFVRCKDEIFLTPETIRAALLQCAKECYKEAAKVAGRSLGPASAAAAIRSLAEEVGK